MVKNEKKSHDTGPKQEFDLQIFWKLSNISKTVCVSTDSDPVTDTSHAPVPLVSRSVPESSTLTAAYCRKYGISDGRCRGAKTTVYLDVSVSRAAGNTVDFAQEWDRRFVSDNVDLDASLTEDICRVQGCSRVFGLTARYDDGNTWHPGSDSIRRTENIRCESAECLIRVC